MHGNEYTLHAEWPDIAEILDIYRVSTTLHMRPMEVLETMTNYDMEVLSAGSQLEKLLENKNK